MDGNYPYLHLDQKFMHLGFHIFDVGFQSPNVEAARPLVYATALLLVIIIALVALSHWVLDVVTHRPDMPITLSDATRIGFGLWNFPLPALVLELTLFAGGIWLYQRHTRAINRKGSIGLWALVGFLLVIYAANLLGPPPPSVAAVGWSAQALWLLVAWGFWVDRNRSNRQVGDS